MNNLRKISAMLQETSALLGMGFLVILVLPRTAAALSGLLVALATACVMIFRPRGNSPGATSRKVAIAFGGLAGAAVLRAIFTDAPLIAMFGARGQRTGALLWVLLALVFWMGLTRGRRGDLMRISVAVTGITTAAATSVLAERLGLVAFAGRTADTASGQFDNSISLAQILILGLGCSLLLCASAAGWRRYFGIIGSIVSILALFASNTRAAYMALVVATALLGLLLVFAKYRRVNPGLVASFGVATAVAALIVPLVLAFIGVGNPTIAALDLTLNGRVAVWTSALAKVETSPWLGIGPEQFNGLVRWDAVPGEGVRFSISDDPHNVMIYWLLALGIPGVLLMLVVVWIVAERLTKSLVASRWNPGLLFVVGALLTNALVILTAWTSPYAAVISALLFAAILVQTESSNNPGDGAPRAHSRGLQAAVGIAVTAMLIAGWPTISAEYQWSMSEGGERLKDSELLELSRRTDDAVYAIQASERGRSLISGADDRMRAAALLESVEGVLARHSARSARAALELVLVRYTAAAVDAGPSWAQVAADLKRAKGNHSQTGMWDYMGTAFAAGMGETSDVRSYASAALTFPLPGPVARWCAQRSQ